MTEKREEKRKSGTEKRVRRHGRTGTSDSGNLCENNHFFTDFRGVQEGIVLEWRKPCPATRSLGKAVSDRIVNRYYFLSEVVTLLSLSARCQTPPGAAGQLASSASSLVPQRSTLRHFPNRRCCGSFLSAVRIIFASDILRPLRRLFYDDRIHGSCRSAHA